MHNLSLLTAVLSVANYFKNLRRAWINERKDWADRRARKRLESIGIASIYANPPSGSYRVEWSDLTNIYDLIQQRKPRVVFEFGAGCSTPMFAKALLDAHGGDATKFTFISFEESEYWADKTRQHYPRELMQYVDLRYVEACDKEFDGLKARSIPDAAFPAQKPNFVYIDGPLAHPETGLISIGVELENGAPDDYFILIDGVGRTYRWTAKNLKRRYHAFSHPYLAYRTFTPVGRAT